MSPNPKDKAIELYKDAYSRWCYEASHDKNIAMAKAIGLYVCSHVLSDMGSDRGYSFWCEVKSCLEELRHEDLYKM